MAYFFPARSLRACAISWSTARKEAVVVDAVVLIGEIRRADQIFSVDGQRGRAGHVEIARHVLGTLDAAVDRERIVSVHKFLFVDALGGQPIRNAACIVDQRALLAGIFFLVYRDENRIVIFGGEPHRIKRVVGARQRLPRGRAERARHRPEFDVRGFALQPRFERRFEVVTVRASVPEKLDDFDFLAAIRGLRRTDQGVIAADNQQLAAPMPFPAAISASSTAIWPTYLNNFMMSPLLLDRLRRCFANFD